MTQLPLTVAILIFDDVEVLDFAGPFEVFNVASELIPRAPFQAFQVLTVGLNLQPVVTRGGLRVQPHYAISDAPPADILIVPGGAGTRRLLTHAPLHAYLREQAAQITLLTSVCTGALVLAAAGLLPAGDATTHHSAYTQLHALTNGQQVCQDQRYVQQGNVITSGGISAGIDMSLAIVTALHGSENADRVRAEMEWNWHADTATQPIEIAPRHA